MRAWLGIAEGKPACYTDTGEPLGDYNQIATERSEARARAEAEATARIAAEQRAEEAEARLRELEATLRRLQQGQ